MTQMMKALAKTKPAEGLDLIEAPVPTPGDDDVLIKVHKTAVCGTDIHIWNWDEWSQKNVPVPMITGHEFAGEIVAIGKDVDRRLKVGQRVSAEGHVIDLNSEAARAGHFHLDPHTRGIGVNRQGAFAEFVVAPAFNVIELPDDVPYEIGAILDPFGNAVHTAQQFDLLGEDVLVTGAGPIGMMAAAVARHAGARTVVLTDINDFRLELAQKVAPGVRTVNTLNEDLNDVMHVGQPHRLQTVRRHPDHGRRHGSAGDSVQADGNGLGHDHPQGPDDQGRLWPRDVHHLAQDAGPAEGRAGPQALDHPPVSL